MTGRSQHLLLVNFTAFYALPVLRAARDRGIRVTVVGPDDAFGRFPEVAAQADGRIVADVGTLHRLLLLERVTCAHLAAPFTGVFVSREDSVAAAADVAAHLGIAWNTPAAVWRMQNKWLTRQTLAQAGFRQPAHHLCSSADDVRELLEAERRAWIVKPLTGTGSRGISRVASTDEVEPAVEHVRATQPSGPFLAEQAVEPALEYSIEGVWLGNRPQVLAVTAKQTSGPPHFVELGHTLPAELDDRLDALIRRTAMRGLTALGASHGLFHVEVFVDDDGVVFGEAHPRAGGDRITQLLQLAGMDLYGLALDGLFGPLPPPVRAPERVAAVRYFRFAPGVLERLDGLESVTGAADVVYCHLDVQPGDRIDPVLHSFSRHGCFVVVGQGYAETNRRADRLRSLVTARVA